LTKFSRIILKKHITEVNCLIDRLKLVNLIAIFSLSLISANSGFTATDYLEHSVFRITNFQQRPDWKSPWKMKHTNKGQGSGFLIEDGFILTNAHVVSDSRMLLVNKLSSPNPFLADVVAIAHDSDLALLKVRDLDFYKNSDST
jgi:Trypsin-like serine proteases, typically periplasmic, contain C-terminal PDZ domain